MDSKHNIIESETALYKTSISWFEPRHEIFNNMVCVTSKGSDQPGHMCSLIRAFASRFNILWLLGLPYCLNSIQSF